MIYSLNNINTIVMPSCKKQKTYVMPLAQSQKVKDVALRISLLYSIATFKIRMLKVAIELVFCKTGWRVSFTVFRRVCLPVVNVRLQNSNCNTTAINNWGTGEGGK